LEHCRGTVWRNEDVVRRLIPYKLVEQPEGEPIVCRGQALLINGRSVAMPRDDRKAQLQQKDDDTALRPSPNLGDDLHNQESANKT
jgi:hypothetical protein